MFQLTKNNTVLFQSTRFDAVWKYALNKLGNISAADYKAQGYAIGKAPSLSVAA